MKYLFEMHAHTAETSPCSNIKASALVKEYKENGYSGVVITDHVGDWGFSNITGSWKKKIDYFVRGYEAAREAGDKLGITVLFGAEIAISHPYQDYLVYGIDSDFLYKHINIHKYSVQKLYELIQEENALLIVAHPFRGKYTDHNPAYLNGAEVFNSNPRNESNNTEALKWANENNLIKTAGSDYHEYIDIASGVLLNECPNDICDFVKILKSREYELHCKLP